MFVEQQKKRAWMVTAVLIGLIWFAAIRIVWGDWLIDPQYGYGMLVPLLMLGLLFKRIPDTPLPEPPQSGPKWLGESVLFGACLILALAVPLAEANPDWRPVGLVACLMAVSASLAVLYLTGGKPWLRHFSFPVVFFFVAVPWPRNFEQSLMGCLMSWNAAATLEILHWLGYEALRQGNMIVIPCGMLGVEEACSGVRSLQSGMMVSLFFGEVLRLGVWRKGLLVVAAVAAALAGNILRNALLAVVASRQGIDSVSLWHDPAGLLVLLVTFGTVMILAYRWRGTVTPAAAHDGGDVCGRSCPASSPMFLPAAVLMIVAFVGTEAWYRMHESESGSVRTWTLHPLGSQKGAAKVTIPRQTMKMLFYPEGFSERWQISDHVFGQSFYFRWPSGRTSQQAVTMHNPEACLSSIGMTLTRALPPYVHEADGVRIPFRAWLFKQRGEGVHVFQALVEEGGAGIEPTRPLDDSAYGRLSALLEGRRNRGQRMIEVAFWNLPDEQSAGEALDRYLQGALTVEMTAAPMKR